MKNQSLTITGLIVTLLSTLSQNLNLGFNDGDIASLVMAGFQIGGILVAWYGRVRKGDVNSFGKRKNNQL